MRVRVEPYIDGRSPYQPGERASTPQHQKNSHLSILVFLAVRHTKSNQYEDFGIVGHLPHVCPLDLAVLIGLQVCALDTFR